MRKFNELSKSEIEQAIQESEYLAEVLRSLDCIDNGYNRTRLKQFIEDNSINTSHIKIRLNKESYEANPKLCLQCGKPIPYEHRDNKFCDSSCAASYNNKGVIKRSKKELRYCLCCGKELNTHQSKYCSNECQSRYEQQEWVERWKSEKISGTTGEQYYSHRIRRYLFEKYNNSCQCCGWNIVNPHTGLVPLQVHHIDGDCKNNKEENLQLLCPNCHALTENFGSRNENATRVDLRMR